MAEYWTSFAKTGHPYSATAGVAWPAYDASTQTNIVLRTIGATSGNITVESSKELCAFWDGIGYNH